MLEVNVNIDRQRPRLRVQDRAGFALFHHGVVPWKPIECHLGGWTLPFLVAADPDNPKHLVSGSGRRYGAGDGDTVSAEELHALGLSHLNTTEDQLRVFAPYGSRLLVFDDAMKHLASRDSVLQNLGLDIRYGAAGELIGAHSQFATVALERDSNLRTTIRTSSSTMRVEYDDLYRSRVIVTDHDATELEYDQRHRLVGIRKAPSGEMWRFRYDSADNLTSVEYPSGETRELIGVDGSDGYSVTSTMGFAGEQRVVVSQDPTGTRTRSVFCCGAPPTVTETSALDTRTSVRHPDGGRTVRRARTQGSSESITTTPTGVVQRTTTTGTLRHAPGDSPTSPRSYHVKRGASSRLYAYDPMTRRLEVSGSDGCDWMIRYDTQGRVISQCHARLSPVFVEDQPNGEIAITQQLESEDTNSDTRVAEHVVLGLAAVDRGLVQHVYNAHALAMSRTDTETLYSAGVPSCIGSVYFEPPPGRSPIRVEMPSGQVRRLDHNGYYPSDGALGDSVPVPVATTDSQGRVRRLRWSSTEWHLEREIWPGRIVRAESEGIRQMRSYDGPLPIEDVVEAEVTTRVETRFADGFRAQRRRLNSAEPLRLEWDDDRLRGIGPVRFDRSGCRHLGSSQVSIGGLAIREDRTAHGLTRTVLAAGQSIASQQVAYDSRGRLTRFEEHGFAQDGYTLTASYDYGNAGILVETAENQAVSRANYDGDGAFVSVSGPDGVGDVESDVLGRITRFGDVGCIWDDAGNLREVTGPTPQTFEYDDRGFLRQSTRGGVQVSFRYDLFGRLVGRSEDGNYRGYLLDRRGRLVGIADSDGVVSTEYVYGSHLRVPNAVRLGDRWYLVVPGPSETVRYLVDAETGQPVEHRSYGPWGYPRDPAQCLQPLGYGSGIEEPGFGLVCLGRRWYMPEIRMWITPDPHGIFGGDPNLHRYARNDPLNYVDSGGTQSVYIGVGLSAHEVDEGHAAQAGIAFGDDDVDIYGSQGPRSGIGGSAGGGLVIGFNDSGMGPPNGGRSVGITTPIIGVDASDHGIEVSIGPTWGFDAHWSGWSDDGDNAPNSCQRENSRPSLPDDPDAPHLDEPPPLWDPELSDPPPLYNPHLDGPGLSDPRDLSGPQLG